MIASYTILSGSTRADSQSLKVARYLAGELAARDSEAAIELVDLARTELPMWHEGFWHGETDARWQRLATQLIESDALIVVAPEWNGMVPPALMNVFLLCEHGEIAHKPALAVGVSATGGGANPVVAMRAFTAKNTHVCYLPDHILVRDSRNVLSGAEPSGDADVALRGRIGYGLDVLRVYAAAFRLIRKSGVIDLETYPYGM